MTITDLQLGMNQGTTTYGPFSYGSHAGEPVVDVSVSTSETNQMDIQSIDSLFESYNWKRKLSSGFARLQFNGQNIFDEQHTEGVTELSRLLDATFVDFEVGENELQQRPSRDIQNTADYYRIFVPKNYDFDEDVLQFFVKQANRHGNIDFLFKVDSPTDKDYINEVSRTFNMYDSHVWLYPRGRKARTVSDRMDIAMKMAKTYTWNVSPRMGILSQASEEITDSDE